MTDFGTKARWVQWPRYHDGSIMWHEVDSYDTPVTCPLCGAAVFDTSRHVRWHEQGVEDAPASTTP